MNKNFYDHRMTPVQVEAALCVWEWMVSQMDNGDTSAPVSQIEALREDFGTPMLRHLAMRAAPEIARIWEELPEEARHSLISYDYTFIPEVCLSIDWADQMSKPGNELIEFSDEERSRIDLMVYTHQAAEWADQLYAYPDLVRDDPETTEAAFRGREPVKDFVERLGNKFALNRR